MKIIVLFFLSIAFVSCVSVQIQPKKIKASSSYSFENPKSNFEKKESNDVDHLWIDSKSGNTISIRSACNDPADPDLASVRLASLDGLVIEKEMFNKNIEYNKREALHSLQEVRLDGISVNIEIINFTKDSCYYILSHIAVNKNFQSTKKDFETFVSKFKVP